MYREVRRTGRGEDDMIMLGDFNAATEASSPHPLGQIPGVTPLVRGVYSNTRQNELYDNLMVHQPSTTEYRRSGHVFDFAQRSTSRRQRGGAVSDHFPVWAEFSAYERDYAGGIASRGGTTR